MNNLFDIYFITILLICGMIFSFCTMFMIIGLAILCLILLIPWMIGMAISGGWEEIRDEVKKVLTK